MPAALSIKPSGAASAYGLATPTAFTIVDQFEISVLEQLCGVGAGCGWSFPSRRP